MPSVKIAFADIIVELTDDILGAKELSTEALSLLVYLIPERWKYENVEAAEEDMIGHAPPEQSRTLSEVFKNTGYQ